MNRKITSAALIATAIATAPVASAASMYMDGVLNVGPKWETITAPGGQTCPRTTCREVKYNYLTPESATNAALAWMRANDNADAVAFGFSLGSIGLNDARALMPNWKGTIVLAGTPVVSDKSYNDGGRPPLNVGGGKVDIITAQTDSVAGGTSFSTHLNGYSGRNFQKESPLSVTPDGSSTHYVYTPRAPKPTTSTPATPRFNLFDIRTWFVPRTTSKIAPTTTKVTADEDTAARRSDLGESRADNVDRDADLELDRDAPVRVSRSRMAEADDAAGDSTAVVRQSVDRGTGASRDAESPTKRKGSVSDAQRAGETTAGSSSESRSTESGDRTSGSEGGGSDE